MKYVDTDVFLYWATDHPKHGERATEILRHVELNEKAVTSALTFWIFNNVMRGTDGYSLASFLEHITRLRNLKVVDLDAETLHEADAVAREHEIPLEVAVGVVVARDRGADAVYSRKPEFEQAGLPRAWD